jgi:CDP-diacylglycerol--glycerol-3-phosphate 3-phosphatidyltransferase
MIDERLRGDVERRLRPVGARAGKARLKADHLTLLGLLMAVATAVATGIGALNAAVLLLVLTAVPDALDGAVAKATGTASPRGSFFDSVADRASDALLLGGVAWYLAGDGGHIVLLPMALLAVSMLVSYQRAKAESLGFSAKGGVMERAERLIALGLGLLFDFLLVPILWVMLALTTFTAVQRFVKVWRQASSAPPAEPLADRWRQRRVARRSTSSWRLRARTTRRP